MKSKLSLLIILLFFSFSLTVSAQLPDVSGLKKVAAYKLYESIEKFALAYMEQDAENAKSRIRVTLSLDGSNWADAQFPDLQVIQLKFTSGVGICGNEKGDKIIVVFNDTRGGIYLVEGSVTGTTVSWSTPAKYLSVDNAKSAPSCSILPNNLILIAIQSSTSMTVHEYYKGDGYDEIVGQATPLQFNQNTEGRPSIATIHDTSLMAWRQWNQNDQRFDIVLAQGQMIQSGPITNFLFDPYKSGLLQLRVSDVGPSALSDPILASDGKNFYLAVIQSEKGSPLHGWRVILYKSIGVDLFSGWQEYGSIPLKVHNQTQIGLAAQEEAGMFVSAKIRDLSRGSNEYETLLFTGGTWHALSTAPWLNAQGASYRSFGLTRFGVHRHFPFKIRPSASK